MLKRFTLVAFVLLMVRRKPPNQAMRKEAGGSLSNPTLLPSISDKPRGYDCHVTGD